MRAITIMFDSLNRHMLSAYGCSSTITPNFARLAEKSVIFDNFYAGSLPCMPARRELHTGRYNFLHRNWGPLEPFDDSAPQMLAANGIYTHFVSDHAHYWQDGGLTYHNKYSTYDMVRGQEGDLWKGEAAGFERNLFLRKQDAINRKYIKEEKDFPHVKCFNSAMEFLNHNYDADNWYLHLEYFDPHEPFFAPDKYKKMYSETISDYDWPVYCKLTDEEKERLAEVRNNYMALLTMCDTYLGKVMDFMDEHDMWKDTMLIVNTDHGFLLGEHGYYAKNYMPIYNEIAQIPFFIWDPVSAKKGIRKKQLCQTIDIAPTLLDFFNADKTEFMLGSSLLPVVRDDEKIRDYALFGHFGKHLNITDGRYVYMRASTDIDKELNNYTIMPTDIFTPFSVEELRKTSKTLVDDFKFTKGVPVMKIPTSDATAPQNSTYWYNRHVQYGSLLFDLEKDPAQNNPIHDVQVEARMLDEMKKLMTDNEAPTEQYERLGLKK